MTGEPIDTLIAFAQQKLAVIEEQNLRRTLRPLARGPHGEVFHNGRRYVSFCDNDYLGLSTDPRLAEAGIAAYSDGAGSGASRLVCGENRHYRALETGLAKLKNTEAALVFGSGYLANISTIPVLVGPGDTIVMDELAHACIHAGARLSGADIALFAHNCCESAALALQKATGQRRLLITETIFSMDGDRAPLDGLNAVCAAHNAWLMTDDAHGLGIIEAQNPAPIQMGTLSKAAGVYGGYVCGPRALIDLLINRGRGLIYTTALPPAIIASASKAIEIIRQEPELGRKTMAHTALFCRIIGQKPPQSPIVPIMLGSEQRAITTSQALYDAGFIVVAIRPPTVPSGTARLRISFRADHITHDVERLGRHVNSCLEVLAK